MSGTGLAASLRAGSTQAFPASAFEYASEFFARWSMGQTLKQLLGYAARGLSLVWFDDLVKSTKGEAPTHSLGMAATNGAIGFAMGTWNCKFLGPWSLICGAVEGGMMFASEYADDTELDIKWENMNQVSTIENIVVSDSIKNCGKLEKGSGFKLPAQHYSGGKLEGWSLNSFAYQGTPCGMFSFSGFWDHLKSGGGFTISVIIPKGAELSCTDCGAMTSECQKKADTWKDPVSGEKICCKECTILQQDALLGGYHGMPSQKATAASGNLVSA
jgi:hypothetical protein